MKATRLARHGTALALAWALLAPTPASAESWGDNANSFSFAVIGDMPYDPIDATHMNSLITAINLKQPAFVIHVGDIKGGGTQCSDELLSREIQRLNQIEAPVFYTPGDNEWLDCQRASNGGYNPFERLDFLRQLAFSTPQTLGAKPRPYQRQSAAHPENASWTHNNILFTTIHIVGSNNARGLGGDNARARYNARSRANIAWLNQAFERALDDQTKALVVVIHANPFIGVPFISGYSGFQNALRERLRTFRKPVLLIHGDTHRFVIDQPWRNSKNQDFDNFTRLQTFGDEDIHAVLTLVDPEAPAVFAFAPLYGRGTRGWVDDRSE